MQALICRLYGNTTCLHGYFRGRKDSGGFIFVKFETQGNFNNIGIYLYCQVEKNFVYTKFQRLQSTKIFSIQKYPRSTCIYMLAFGFFILIVFTCTSL